LHRKRRPGGGSGEDVRMEPLRARVRVEWLVGGRSTVAAAQAHAGPDLTSTPRMKALGGLRRRKFPYSPQRRYTNATRKGVLSGGGGGCDRVIDEAAAGAVMAAAVAAGGRIAEVVQNRQPAARFAFGVLGHLLLARQIVLVPFDITPAGAHQFVARQV